MLCLLFVGGCIFSSCLVSCWKILYILETKPIRFAFVVPEHNHCLSFVSIDSNYTYVVHERRQWLVDVGHCRRDAWLAFHCADLARLPENDVDPGGPQSLTARLMNTTHTTINPTIDYWFEIKIFVIFFIFSVWQIECRTKFDAMTTRCLRNTPPIDFQPPDLVLG